jgi:glucose/arabinose dehydrogenase
MKHIKLRALVMIIFILPLAACDNGATPTPVSPNGAPSPSPTVVASNPATATTSIASAPASSTTSASVTQTDTLQPGDIIVPSAYTTFKPGSQISLPPGFKISLFANGLNTPRMMAFAPNGDLFVANRGGGQVVALPDRNQDGVTDSSEVFAEGLDNPHSLVFYNNYLYVASDDSVVRYPYKSGDLKASAAAQLVTNDVVVGNGHTTRTIAISPDGKQLYLSAGSSCNVCEDTDDRRAAISVFDLSADGKATNRHIFASGIRNAVGIEFQPGTNNLWAVVNNRDDLGDNVPSETLLQVQSGQNYGWPYCYTQDGKVVYDSDFGQKDASVCQNVSLPALEMQAHSAPLGLEFYTGKQFPANYQGNLFIGFHGSWNRSVPTGVKVVRVPFVNGKPQPPIDFATGWLQGSSHWGRPVDPLTAPDGSLYLSDDTAGVVYRIYYQP